MGEFTYAGSELDIFSQAVHWKRYFARLAAPYIQGDVLEPGAGIGANLHYFTRCDFRMWTCLEPDRALAERLSRALPDTARYQICVGTLDGLGGRGFDTILYIDVLEHIKDDAEEVRRAARILNPGGRLIVLAPAHAFLFTPFDRAIGHFRRYTKHSLAAIMPERLRPERLLYLDSAGVLASLASRFFLRSGHYSRWQVYAWDSLLVPVSSALDRCLGYRVGKSVLGVWRAE